MDVKKIVWCFFFFHRQVDAKWFMVTAQPPSVGSLLVSPTWTQWERYVNVLHLLPKGFLWAIFKFRLCKYKVYEVDNVVIFFYSMRSFREDFVRLSQMLHMGNNMKQEYFNQRYFFLCRLIERISRHLSTNNLDAHYEFNLAAGGSINLKQ